MADPYDLRRIHPEEATGTDGGSPYRPFKPKKKPKPKYKQLSLPIRLTKMKQRNPNGPNA